MSFYKDAVLGILIGIMYNISVIKTAGLIFSDMDYDNRYQSTLIVCFLLGITAIVLALTLFNKGTRAIKYGLIFGGVLLLIHSMVTNWDGMTDGTQLIIFGLVFFGLVFYCYQNDSSEEDDREKRRVLKNKKVRVENENAQVEHYKNNNKVNNKATNKVNSKIKK